MRFADILSRTSNSAVVVLGIVLLAGSSSMLAQKYESRGKRDPFVSLLHVKEAERVRIVPPPPLSQRPPGLPGLLVSEVTVAGIAAGPSGQLVVLKGIDGVSYLAKKGSTLFDGRIEEVSAERVLFSREQVDTRGNKKTSRVVKKMYSEEQ